MSKSYNSYSDWRDDAKCAELPAEEADYLFFQKNPNNPNRGLRAEPTRQAKAVCQKCPVLKRCLEYALRHPESAEYGVWGGTTVTQRRRILRLGENAINKAIESAGK